MHEIINKAMEEGYLLEHRAMELLGDYGFPVQKHFFVSEGLSPEFPEEINYPVVVKVVSPQIIHKSDVGGVKVNIKSKEELGMAVKTMREGILAKVPEADIHGWKIDPFVPDGLEMIVGAVEDSQFGMALMIGIGGVFTEIINDSCFRVVPVFERDVDEMIDELRTREFFKGFRGNEPVDKTVLKKMLLALNNLLIENPVVREVDLNPVICRGSVLVPVDARIILKTREGNNE